MKSLSYLFFIAMAASSPSHAASNVIGYIDGMEKASVGSGYILRGWACQNSANQSITVRVTFGKPAGEGVAIYSTVADQTSSAAIAARCGTTLGKHNFSISFTKREADRFAGRKIFVYGISTANDETGNAALERSGTFAMPDVNYDTVNCATWNGIVDRNIRLQPANCKLNKQVTFSGPNLSLDCNGASIDGSGIAIAPGSRGQGIGLKTGKEMCEQAEAPGKASRFPDADGSGSLIKNCRITNFAFGVYFNRRVWTKPEKGASCIPLSEFSSQSPQKGSSGDLDQYLGGRNKRYGFNPSDVTIRNLEVSGGKQAGIFVNEYAVNWLIEDSLIQNNGVGIYLERESRRNRVITSTIAKNLGVGVAIDASAYNLLERNLIEKNGSIGVALYKNCGERGGVTRYQHSDGNTLRHNVIRDQRGSNSRDMTLTMSTLSAAAARDKIPGMGVGVWIASRQGLSETWMSNALQTTKAVCSDPGYAVKGQTYYQDHASGNKIIENNIVGNSLAQVIVEDDDNTISNNNFIGKDTPPPLASIIVGSVFRQEDPKLRPVKDIRLTGNQLPETTIENPIMFIGGSKPSP